MIPDSSQSSLRTFLVYILFAAAGFPPPDHGSYDAAASRLLCKATSRPRGRFIL